MNMMAPIDVSRDFSFQTTRASNRQALVVIVSDSPETVQQLDAVCSFFDLAVEIVQGDKDLMPVLLESRPMAVIADIEGETQDGFHTMKIIATYDRDLPVMMLTGGDPVLMGTVDAVEGLWKLTSVTRSTSAHLAGQLAEFLFTAGRRAGCMRLVPI